jgi:hypothetical protein
VHEARLAASDRRAKWSQKEPALHFEASPDSKPSANSGGWYS